MRPTHTAPRRICPPGSRWLAFWVVTLFFASALWLPQAAAQDEWRFRPPTSTGPAVGEPIPAFRALDQNGQMQDFDSIKGPNGAAIYFSRSVDW